MSQHQKNNVATSYGECHASYCNVATLPRHRLRHHSRLQNSKLQCRDIALSHLKNQANVATSGKDCKNIKCSMSRHCHNISNDINQGLNTGDLNLQYRDIGSMMSRHQTKAVKEVRPTQCHDIIVAMLRHQPRH